LRTARPVALDTIDSNASALSKTLSKQKEFILQYITHWLASLDYKVSSKFL